MQSLYLSLLNGGKMECSICVWFNECEGHGELNRENCEYFYDGDDSEVV